MGGWAAADRRLFFESLGVGDFHIRRRVHPLVTAADRAARPEWAARPRGAPATAGPAAAGALGGGELFAGWVDPPGYPSGGPWAIHDWECPTLEALLSREGLRQVNSGVLRKVLAALDRGWEGTWSKYASADIYSAQDGVSAASQQRKQQPGSPFAAAKVLRKGSAPSAFLTLLRTAEWLPVTVGSPAAVAISRTAADARAATAAGGLLKHVTPRAASGGGGGHPSQQLNQLPPPPPAFACALDGAVLVSPSLAVAPTVRLQQVLGATPALFLALPTQPSQPGQGSPTHGPAGQSQLLPLAAGTSALAAALGVRTAVSADLIMSVLESWAGKGAAAEPASGGPARPLPVPPASKLAAASAVAAVAAAVAPQPTLTSLTQLYAVLLNEADKSVSADSGFAAGIRSRFASEPLLFFPAIASTDGAKPAAGGAAAGGEWVRSGSVRVLDDAGCLEALAAADRTNPPSSSSASGALRVATSHYGEVSRRFFTELLGCPKRPRCGARRRNGFHLRNTHLSVCAPGAPPGESRLGVLRACLRVVYVRVVLLLCALLETETPSSPVLPLSPRPFPPTSSFHFSFAEYASRLEPAARFFAVSWTPSVLSVLIMWGNRVARHEVAPDELSSWKAALGKLRVFRTAAGGWGALDDGLCVADDAALLRIFAATSARGHIVDVAAACAGAFAGPSGVPTGSVKAVESLLHALGAKRLSDCVVRKAHASGGAQLDLKCARLDSEHSSCSFWSVYHPAFALPFRPSGEHH